jgi:saccharopine dehydrogenase (NAD+, L-lysine-forming)
VPAAWRTRLVPVRDRERGAVSIPWGDVATAYRSTGIPNITVYIAMPARAVSALKAARAVAPALGIGPLQRLLKALAGRFVAGPSAEARASARTQLWGRAVDGAGRAAEGTLETPESYALTAVTAVEIASRVRAGRVAPGAWTPAQALGGGFIAEIEGCEMRVAAAPAL